MEYCPLLKAVGSANSLNLKLWPCTVHDVYGEVSCAMLCNVVASTVWIGQKSRCFAEDVPIRKFPFVVLKGYSEIYVARLYPKHRGRVIV